MRFQNESYETQVASRIIKYFHSIVNLYFRTFCYVTIMSHYHFIIKKLFYLSLSSRPIAYNYLFHKNV